MKILKLKKKYRIFQKNLFWKLKSVIFSFGCPLKRLHWGGQSLADMSAKKYVDYVFPKRGEEFAQIKIFNLNLKKNKTLNLFIYYTCIGKQLIFYVFQLCMSGFFKVLSKTFLFERIFTAPI